MDEKENNIDQILPNPLKKDRKKLIVSLLILFSLSVLGGSMYWLANKDDYTHTVNINPLPTTAPKVAGIFEEQSPEQPNSLNTLLLGYGGAGHDGGNLTDVVILTHLNTDEHQFKIITIPRDLLVTHANNQSDKLNTIFSKDNTPDFSVTKAAISAITGLPVDYVAAIDFVGFQRMIGETFEGIEVEVSQPLNDPWYPIKGEEVNPCGYTPEEIANLTNTLSGFELEKQFPCRYEQIDVKPGLVNMHGHEALAYVRSRHSSSDFDRSRRQQEVLTAIKNKLFSLESLKHIPAIHEALSKHLVTDIDVKITKALAPTLASLESIEIINVNLSTQNVLTASKSNNGAFILIPKAGQNQWQQVHDFIRGQ